MREDKVMGVILQQFLQLLLLCCNYGFWHLNHFRAGAVLEVDLLLPLKTRRNNLSQDCLLIVSPQDFWGTVIVLVRVRFVLPARQESNSF